jgi:hypothetical protein
VPCLVRSGRTWSTAFADISDPRLSSLFAWVEWSRVHFVPKYRRHTLANNGGRRMCRAKRRGVKGDRGRLPSSRETRAAPPTPDSLPRSPSTSLLFSAFDAARRPMDISQRKVLEIRPWRGHRSRNRKTKEAVRKPSKSAESLAFSMTFWAERPRRHNGTAERKNAVKGS